MSFKDANQGQGQRPTVKMEQGKYMGKTIFDSDLPRRVEAFLGVPYARCERLQRATPPLASSDTFDASECGKVCPTADLSFPAGEDCLSANVFRPALSTEDGGLGEGKKLPVVVYIHGGAFNFGRGADRNLAAFVGFAKRDVVAVGFNYRLGPLGFLPCGAALREGVANLGLMDQRALLEWVQRNIAAFGGDAGDVTVMGFSAGAHSVGSRESLTSPSRDANVTARPPRPLARLSQALHPRDSGIWCTNGPLRTSRDTSTPRGPVHAVSLSRRPLTPARRPVPPRHPHITPCSPLTGLL